MNENENTQAFVKLASELTDRVDALEKENAELQKQLAQAKAMPKVAAEEKRPIVSREVVDATLSALVKCGGIAPEQVDESRKIMLEDAEAPHRILQSFLDAQSQTKTAADSGNISGGTLIGQQGNVKRDAREECMERMISMLKMYD